MRKDNTDAGYREVQAVGRPEPSKARVIGLRLLVLAAAASLLLIVRVTPETPHVDIRGVPAQALEQLGVKFLPPRGTPAVSADEARSIAVSQAPTFGQPILDTVLVRMVDPSSGIDQLVWVNRIDAPSQLGGVPGTLPTGPYIAPGAPTPRPVPPPTYYLIFVDATTGEVLYAVSG
jgi:hypothetical protein